MISYLLYIYIYLSSVFQNCHHLVDFKSYYDACVFDSCRMPNEFMECASLQIYAATCADQGVCIDWREHTKKACSNICPPNKVYKACGPAVEETCKSGLIGQNQTQLIEGCFCPEGTKLYDTAIDVCVETCGCVGPDNIPRKFGEIFQFDCKDCICLEGGNGIICESHKCPVPDEVQCEGEGYQKITKINPNDICCLDTVCVCNTTQCTTKPPQCEPGFLAVANTTEGHCCPFYDCSKSLLTNFGRMNYMPGSEVLGSQCQQCICTDKQNSTTLLNIIECKNIPCNVKCQQVSSSTYIILNLFPSSKQPGENQNDPKDNCTIYSCTRIHRQLISSTSVIKCPTFDENRCQPVSILMPATPSCSASQTMDYINYNGCRSETLVPVTQCEGRCGTFSMYVKSNSMTHKCSCCRESKTAKKEIMLLCPGGIRKKYRYIHVEHCECLNVGCGDKESSSEEYRVDKEISTQPPQAIGNRSRKALE
uniref:CTCK domain-containing protein n=1 Tax=Naja naja TaxID=35670 RepID=A0A8C6X9M3_NAJNA